MKLYASKVKPIADSIARSLISEEAIEVEEDRVGEVVLDIESVLREYLRTQRQINDEARDLMDKRGHDFSMFGKTKREVARRHNFKFGEEAIGWICDQMIEMLLHTVHIEEVWAEDNVLRRVMRDILRKHMDVDSDLDEEVRKRIKNLNEGSDAWDIKYQQVMTQLKDSRGISE